MRTVCRPARSDRAPRHGSAWRADARGSGHARCAGGITGHGDVGPRTAGSEGKVSRPLASRLAGPVLRPGHCRCRGDPRGRGTCLRCTSPVDRFASGSGLRNCYRARGQRFGTGEPGAARVAPGTAVDRAPFRGRGDRRDPAARGSARDTAPHGRIHLPRTEETRIRDRKPRPSSPLRVRGIGLRPANRAARSRAAGRGADRPAPCAWPQPHRAPPG